MVVATAKAYLVINENNPLQQAIQPPPDKLAWERSEGAHSPNHCTGSRSFYWGF